MSAVANLPANDVSTPEQITVPVYDSLGVSHTMTLTLSPSAAVPSTQSFTEAGGIATGDVFQLNIDGHTYNTSALVSGSPTLSDVANALNSALNGTSYSANVVAGKLQITDASGAAIVGSSLTATTGAETFTGGAVANGTPAVPNQWSVAAALTGAGTSTATIAAGDNIIQFNSDGSLIPPVPLSTPQTRSRSPGIPPSRAAPRPRPYRSTSARMAKPTVSARSAPASRSAKSTRTASLSAALAA